jgi:hypothetical protein
LRTIRDGHAGYSNPLDEQNLVMRLVNFLQSRPEWRSTALIIMYDDSDGWYDHQMSPIVNQSQSPADALTGAILPQAPRRFPEWTWSPTLTLRVAAGTVRGSRCRSFRHGPAPISWTTPSRIKALRSASSRTTGWRSANRPRLYRRHRDFGQNNGDEGNNVVFFNPSTGEPRSQNQQ